MKIDHIAFEVADLEKSVSFYRDVLGFALEASFLDEAEHENLAVLALKGGRIELIQALTEQNLAGEFVRPEIRSHFCPHLALQADDLTGVMDMIRKHDLTIVHGPIENPAARWVYIQDPDDNVIEFFQDFA